MPFAILDALHAIEACAGEVVVERNDAMPFLFEALAQMCPDKTRSACH